MTDPHVKVTMKHTYALTLGDGSRLQLDAGGTYIVAPEQFAALKDAEVQVPAFNDRTGERIFTDASKKEQAFRKEKVVDKSAVIPVPVEAPTPAAETPSGT
jgi:hypothetical protein